MLTEGIDIEALTGCPGYDGPAPERRPWGVAQFTPDAVRVNGSAW
jgi:hypothetical protein